MQRQVTKLLSFEGILSDVKEIVPSRKIYNCRNQKVTLSFLSRRFSLLSSSSASSSLQWKSSFSTLNKSCENSNIAFRGLSTFTNQTNNSYNHELCHRRLMSSSSDNQSQDDENSSKVDKKDKSNETKTTEGASEPRKKLNNLLQSIIKDTAERKSNETTVTAESNTAESNTETSTPKVDLAIPSKPLEKRRKKKIKEAMSEPEAEGEVVLGKRVLSAVKKVAESIGGDVEQIESELVQKLKSQSMQKVKLSDLVQGMQVDTLKNKEQQPTETQGQPSYGRSDRVRQSMQDGQPRRSAQYGGYGKRGGDQDGDRRRPPRRDQERYSKSQDSQEGEEGGGRYPAFERVKLFGAPPLNIFSEQVTQTTTQTDEPKTTWNVLEAKELKLSVTHPPANGFEEMIQWTEQKKLWTFPIDNEQGLEEEAQYSFEDHVFLETQIEPWCPVEGPVRTFMELVCVGLAKNPYLTVPEKRDYLEWYYEYFKEKNAILKSLGSPEVKDIGDISQSLNQISAS